jgi:hypothetical protein
MEKDCIQIKSTETSFSQFSKTEKIESGLEFDPVLTENSVRISTSILVAR